MNPVEPTAKLSPEALKRTLLPRLFPDEASLNTFAVLDGAAIPELLDHLYGDPRPEFVCLYRGELEPDMAEVAPYLVRLKRDAFTSWLLNEGWGRHWGVFATTKTDMVGLRKHFRTFLMVKNPEGKQVYFRYYDPRVLRTFLPTCNPGDTATVFGPVKTYLFEAEKADTLMSFAVAEGLPRCETVKLLQP